MTINDEPVASATDVARYFVLLAADDGDLITNLKLQKLVYYAYVWTLAENKRRLFAEPMEAWPSGPVVPELYQQLVRFGTGPIDAGEFLGIETQEECDAFVSWFPADVLETLNGVYEQYMRLSAFDLVALTQSEYAWKKARAGLGPADQSSPRIADSDLLVQSTAA